MGMKHNQFELSVDLIVALDIIGDEFEVTPAELLRIGAMEALNLHPIGAITGERAVLEISWPEALGLRLLAHSEQAGCQITTMVENILWTLLRSFPSQFRSPVRENEAGLARLREHLAASAWW